MVRTQAGFWRDGQVGSGTISRLTILATPFGNQPLSAGVEGARRPKGACTEGPVVGEAMATDLNGTPSPTAVLSPRLV